jgi:hypothetical protein
MLDFRVRGNDKRWGSNDEKSNFRKFLKLSLIFLLHFKLLLIVFFSNFPYSMQHELSNDLISKLIKAKSLMTTLTNCKNLK